MQYREITTTYHTPFGESKEFKHIMHIDLEKVRATGCLELNKDSNLYFIYIGEEKLHVTCDRSDSETIKINSTSTAEYFTLWGNGEDGIAYDFRVEYLAGDGFVITLVDACAEIPREDQAYTVIISDEIVRINEDFTERNKPLIPSVFASTDINPNLDDTRDFMYTNPVIPCGDSAEREWKNINDFILWTYRNSSSFEEREGMVVCKYGENRQTIFGRILGVESKVINGIFPIINDVLYSRCYWLNGDNNQVLITNVENAYGGIGEYFKSALQGKGLIDYKGNGTAMASYLLDLCKIAEE